MAARGGGPAEPFLSPSGGVTANFLADVLPLQPPYKVAVARTAAAGNNFDREVGAVTHILAARKDHFPSDSFCAVTSEQLGEQLAHSKPNILHYVGHGSGQIQQLAEVIQLHAPGVKVAILNACRSNVFLDQLFAKTNVEYVICTSVPVVDELAEQFASALWRSITSDQRTTLGRAFGTALHEVTQPGQTPVFQLISKEQYPEQLINVDINNVLQLQEDATQLNFPERLFAVAFFGSYGASKSTTAGATARALGKPCDFMVDDSMDHTTKGVYLGKQEGGIMLLDCQGQAREEPSFDVALLSAVGLATTGGCIVYVIKDKMERGDVASLGVLADSIRHNALATHAQTSLVIVLRTKASKLRVTSQDAESTSSLVQKHVFSIQGAQPILASFTSVNYLFVPEKHDPMDIADASNELGKSLAAIVRDKARSKVVSGAEVAAALRAAWPAIQQRQALPIKTLRDQVMISRLKADLKAELSKLQQQSTVLKQSLMDIDDAGEQIVAYGHQLQTSLEGKAEYAGLDATTREEEVRSLSVEAQRLQDVFASSRAQQELALEQSVEAARVSIESYSPQCTGKVADISYSPFKAELQQFDSSQPKSKKALLARQRIVALLQTRWHQLHELNRQAHSNRSMELKASKGKSESFIIFQGRDPTHYGNGSGSKTYQLAPKLTQDFIFSANITTTDTSNQGGFTHNVEIPLTRSGNIAAKRGGGRKWVATELSFNHVSKELLYSTAHGGWGGGQCQHCVTLVQLTVTKSQLADHPEYIQAYTAPALNL